MDIENLVKTFNYSLFSQQFSKVKRQNLTTDYRSWTFYSYLRRAAATFGAKGDRILYQAHGFNSFMRKRVKSAIHRRASRKVITSRTA